MNAKNGPAVATDATQFKTPQPRGPSADQRLRDDADEVLMEKVRQRSAKYKSLETGEEIELSLPLIKSVVSVKTRSGKEPSDADCFKFMKLCEARRLNPLVGDAYLIGYDTKTFIHGQGEVWVATFQIIVAHSALLKRAELSGVYNGMESGVIVRDRDTKDLLELPGDFYDPDSQTVVGGWAKVHREDRSVVEYDRLNRLVYDTERSRWQTDPGGMIVKVAEASVLRRAFPGETAGMYVMEEMEHLRTQLAAAKETREFDVDGGLSLEPMAPGEDRLAKQDTPPTQPVAAKSKTSMKPKVRVKPKATSTEPAVAVTEPEVETKSEPVAETSTETVVVQEHQPTPAVQKELAVSDDADVDIEPFIASLANHGMIRSLKQDVTRFLDENVLTVQQREAVQDALEDRVNQLMADANGDAQ